MLSPVFTTRFDLLQVNFLFCPTFEEKVWGGALSKGHPQELFLLFVSFGAVLQLPADQFFLKCLAYFYEPLLSG